VISTLLLSLILCQPAPPKPVPAMVGPKAVITLRGGKPIPAKIEANRTLFLSAKKSSKDPECIVKWVVFPPSLLADPENFSKFEDGTEFVLNVGPVEQEILIGAAVSGGKQVDIVAVTIIVGKGPRPPPDPNPPGPKPVDLTGIAKASYDAARVIGNKSDCAKLAKTQRGIASAIAAGGLTDAAAVLQAWREANRAAVSAMTWAAWGMAMKTELETLNAAGQFSTKAQWQAPFVAMAEGLEAAAQ